MKTIEDMAHDYAIAILQDLKCVISEQVRANIAYTAFELAEAMQAEAEKRKSKEDARSLTKDKDGNCLHFHHEFGHKKCLDCCASLEKWQPDWSQAPDDADYWAMDMDNKCYWFANEPHISNDYNEWVNETHYYDSISFNYQGNWKDSLRKRP